jgi:hypothetical protein
MPILVSCPCGKHVRVKDELGGKRIKCPACAGVVQVPVAGESQLAVPAEDRVRPTAAPPRPKSDRARSEPEHGAAPPELPRADPGPRCFWQRAGDLLAVSDDALLLASLDDKEMRKAKAALSAGDAPETVLGDSATVIPFRHIKKIQSDLHEESIEVKWRAPDASEDAEKTIACADKETRDEIMASLRERLGPDWKHQVNEYSRLRASLEPLMIIGVFGFLTFCFYMAGAHPEDDKSSGGTKTVRTNIIGVIFAWVYNLLGPIAVAVLGGLFVALGVAWLVLRLIRPPIMLTLTPAPDAPRRKRRK